MRFDAYPDFGRRIGFFHNGRRLRVTQRAEKSGTCVASCVSMNKN